MTTHSRRGAGAGYPRSGHRVGLWPAVAAFALYIGSLSFGFVHDDVGLIRSLDGTDPPARGLYRSVARISHGLDYELWGANAFGFHLTNVLLHVAVTVLVTGTLVRLTRDSRAALIGGLLFALHPLHVEAVVVAANRRDILALGFCLLGLNAWLTYGPTPRGVLTSGVAYLLGLLSKEVAAVAFPVTLIVLETSGLRGGAGPRGLAARRAYLVSTAFVAIGFGAAAWGTGGFVDRFRPFRIATIHAWQITHYEEVLVNAGAALPRALLNLVVPARTSVDYPLIPIEHGAMPAIAGLVLALLLVAIAGWLLRRRPAVGFGMAWIAITLLPYANLIPLSPYYFADRYLYVPSFGWCLLAGVLASRLIAIGHGQTRHALTYTMVTLAITTTAAWSFARISEWRSDARLFASAQARGFGTLLVYRQLGQMAAIGGRWHDAARWFDEASRLVPLSEDRVALGYDGAVQRRLLIAYHQAGAADSTVVTARALALHFPRDADAHFLLGENAWARGDRRAAVDHLGLALAERPTWVRAMGELAWLRAVSPEPEVRDPEEAVRLAEGAVRLLVPPRAWALHTLAVALAESGDFEAAMIRAEEALSRARMEGRPDVTDRIEAEMSLIRRRSSLTIASLSMDVPDEICSDFFGFGGGRECFPLR